MKIISIEPTPSPNSMKIVIDQDLPFGKSFNYTKENIDGMLNRRHLHRELRKQGKYHSKSKKRQALSDVSFKNSLKELIEKQVKTIDNF